MKPELLKEVPDKWIYFPKYSVIVFLLVLFALSVIYGYHQIIFLPAQSLHLWRQCDCLSQAMNYYQDGNHFFEPALHNLGSDGTGKAVSDFPVIYYLTGKIWNFTGPDESVMRMINLVIFYSGLLLLFKSAERLLRDSFFALFIAFLLFSSPMLVYYANNFLMDVPAFSFALAGMYFFMRFYFSGKQVHLYFFAFCFGAAGLLKISSLLGFFAVVGIFILERAGMRFKPGSKIFPDPIRQIFPFILVLAIQLGWYAWVRHYNALHNPGIFLTHVIPLWSLSNDEINMVLQHLADHFRWNYFRPEIAVFITLLFTATLIYYKRTSTTLQTVLVLLVAGSLAFCILFFRLLKEHDYYMINILIVVPAVLLSFAKMFKGRFPKMYRSVLFRVLLVAVLVHSVDFARRRIEGRYDVQSWQNQDYNDVKSKFRELPRYLDSLGIKPGDKVISLPDPSVNVSLYLMNRKGWTNYNIQNRAGRIEEKIRMGAKYLIISNPEILKSAEMAPFTRRKIGQYEMIHIFQL